MSHDGMEWRSALLASPLPLLVHAEDGEVLLASHSLSALTGFAPGELATMQDWTTLAYGDDAERVREGIARLYTLETPVREGEFTVRARDGAPGVWDFSSAPLGALADGRRVVLSVATDVTSRVRAEAEIRRLNDELEERVATRTAEVEGAYVEMESFAYAIAHELRAPLRAVNGYADILMREYLPSLGDKGRDLAGSIARSATTMADLIDDLLALARAGRRAPVVAPVDMQELVAGCYAEVLEGHAEYRGELVVGCLPHALGDRALLAQLMSNLLDNAVKYSAPRERPRIEVSGHATDLACTYSVRDNGVGFDPAFAQRMFDVFERLHGDDFPGTGIGLAIAERVVHRHHGRIWAWSVPGEGAEISFLLPLSGNGGA